MRITKISDDINRITADNGEYLLALEQILMVGKKEISVIDPGPDLSNHIDDIIEMGNGKITDALLIHIKITHQVQNL